MSLAYAGLLLFILVYCARPSDWIPGAAGIPFGKITGLLALAGFGLSVMLGGRGVLRLPREMLLLVLLFGQLCLAVLFSIWPGGSFRLIATEFWKVVLITIVIAVTVNSLARLRWLLLVQTASVAAMAVLVATRSAGAEGVGFRASGVVGGVFANPNDFAINVALVFPFCFAFLLETRSPLAKATWALAMAVMAYAVMMTYSRTGFLALLVALAFCLWEFGLKQRRHHLLVLVGMAGLVVVLLGNPGRYAARIASILVPDIEAGQDHGSTASRREMLLQGLAVTAKNPLLGVGPGNFQVVSGIWKGTHNTYLQLSSEAGIPALILFLLIFRRLFLNLRRRQRLTPGEAELQLFGGALRASLLSFLVGAFLADTAYHFFPYFLMGYCSAYYQITRPGAARIAQSSPAHRAKDNGRDDKPKMAGIAY